MNTIYNQITSEAELSISDEGQLNIYISDALAPDLPESKAALEWACNAVNNEGEREYALTLNISLPQSVEEMLEFFNEGTTENKQIPVLVKKRFDILRAQLVESLAILDKVEYIG